MIMKRLILIITLLVAVPAGPAAAGDELNVICTVTDLGWLAARVGGDAVNVTVLCPGEQDPHFLPAKPSLARKLGKADLLCYTGLELEVGWLPVLLEKARNPRVRPGKPGDLDCSRALVRVLEVPVGEVSRAQGDVHPLGNPHFLLDPRNGVLVAALMAERLGELRPEAAAAFAARAEELAAELAPRIDAWKRQAETVCEHPLVVHTKQWEYLADWLDLDLLGAVEHRPGISPSPRHVDELVSRAQRAEVHVVMAAPWNHLDVSRKAAARMGAELVVLPAAVAAVPVATGYPEMFDLILARLVAATGG
jgi:zinc/manganese transport system substrate-binding protein